MLFCLFTCWTKFLMFLLAVECNFLCCFYCAQFIGGFVYKIPYLYFSFQLTRCSFVCTVQCTYRRETCYAEFNNSNYVSSICTLHIYYRSICTYGFICTCQYLWLFHLYLTIFITVPTVLDNIYYCTHCTWQYLLLYQLYLTIFVTYPLYLTIFVTVPTVLDYIYYCSHCTWQYSLL